MHQPRELRRARLSYANVMATIAVFIALGGTVYAAGKINGKQIKPNSIPGNRIKQGTLTGTQLNSATIGTVPNANHAGNSDQLGGAPGSAYLMGGTTIPGGDLTGTYANPMIANGAVNQAKLAAPESWHEIGAAGEPTFQNSWQNLGGGDSTAAFFKDPFGIVHIKGLLKGCTNGVGICTSSSSGTPAFTLPSGDRPSKTLNFVSIDYHGSPFDLANVLIDTSGNVTPTANLGHTEDGLALDGITFRACGAPGAEAC